MSNDPQLVFQALADPTRRRLVERLAEGDTKTASELAQEFPISRQGLLKHLQILVDAQLIDSRQVGRERRYFLNPTPLNTTLDWIQTINQQWDARLQRLRDYLMADEDID